MQDDNNNDNTLVEPLVATVTTPPPTTTTNMPSLNLPNDELLQSLIVQQQEEDDNDMISSELQSNKRDWYIEVLLSLLLHSSNNNKTHHVYRNDETTIRKEKKQKNTTRRNEHSSRRYSATHCRRAALTLTCNNRQLPSPLSLIPHVLLQQQQQQQNTASSLSHGRSTATTTSPTTASIGLPVVNDTKTTGPTFPWMNVTTTTTTEEEQQQHSHSRHRRRKRRRRPSSSSFSFPTIVELEHLVENQFYASNVFWGSQQQQQQRQVITTNVRHSQNNDTNNRLAELESSSSGRMTMTTTTTQTPIITTTTTTTNKIPAVAARTRTTNQHTPNTTITTTANTNMFVPFSIVYNECSLTTIATWAVVAETSLSLSDDVDDDNNNLDNNTVVVVVVNDDDANVNDDDNDNENNSNDKDDSPSTTTNATTKVNKNTLTMTTTSTTKHNNNNNNNYTSPCMPTISSKTDLLQYQNYYCPVPSFLFRKCNHCQRWGHYDTTCQQLQLPLLDASSSSSQQQQAQEEAIVELSRQVKLQRALQQQQQQQQRPPVVVDSLGGRFSRSVQQQQQEQEEDSIMSDVSSVTDLEGCEGFVIELSKMRRKKKRFRSGELAASAVAVATTSRSPSSAAATKDDDWDLVASSPHAGWQSTIGIVRHPLLGKGGKDNDHDIDVDEGVAASSEMDTGDSKLSPGELCWMRQSGSRSRNDDNARPRPYERDDWWPSVVLSVRVGEDDKPNYVVKRFAMMSARTKATVLLPFFKHFERLGYNRVHGHRRHPPSEPKDTGLFQKALNMAVQEAGLLSLSHALRVSREIAGLPSTEVLDLHDAHVREETWDEADDAVQDGILIRAKRDPLIDGCSHQSNSDEVDSFLNGSVVAWRSDDETDPILHVGIVLASDIGNETALVRPIRNWQECLSDISRRDSLVVKSCFVGASVWMDMKELHVIRSGAPLAMQERFSEHVLPKRLHDERERLRRTFREAQTSKAAPSPV